MSNKKEKNNDERMASILRSKSKMKSTAKDDDDSRMAAVLQKSRDKTSKSSLKTENKDLTEKYNALLNSVINKEPVTFKKIFEDVMRLKATEYVALVKEDMAKTVFNVSEVHNDRLDEDYDPEIEFHVMDKSRGVPVGKYSNIKRARNALDKRHNEYGGYSNHTINYFHKGTKQYVPFSQTAKPSEG